MSETTRTFIAVEVPEAVAGRLRRLQQQLAGEVPGVRWVDTPPFHVTLAFLGDVAHADLNGVCRAVAEAAAAHAPLELTLEGLGAFPDATRPRVVWAGVSGAGVEELAALQAAVAEAVAREHYPTDGKPFHPHVTLGRLKPGRGRPPTPARPLAHVLSHYRAWRAGPFRVTEAVAFASTPGPDGPSYAPLARGRLAGRKPGASP